MRGLLVTLLAGVALVNGARHGRKGRSFATPVVGTYFPDWAQYRPSPYTFTPESMGGIVDKLNVIWYGFVYFCPDSSMVQPYWVTQLGRCNGKQPFELTNPEGNDPQYYQEIANYKNSNSDLKVLFSVGGWNFPSNFFSGMVASKTNRQTFIQSCLEWLQRYNFDGIDLDWEYPCSPARQDYVKISCQKFDYVEDDGGADCATDRANLLKLVTEMREAFGDKYLITVAAQADMKKATDGFNLTAMSEQIDLWNLMTYDYTVSDLPDSSITAANQPLYPPKDTSSISQDSTSVTIDGYIAQGVDPGMINVGIAYYGHTWYAPGLSGSAWQKFGLTAQIQGECCLEMAQTYGGKYGQYSQLCGSYMYSEIKEAGFNTMLDNVTKSNIGYMSHAGNDGWTAQGIWISYQDTDCIGEILKYSSGKGLAGAFAFDVSQDTVGTFELTNYIYQTLN